MPGECGCSDTGICFLVSNHFSGVFDGVHCHDAKSTVPAIYLFLFVMIALPYMFINLKVKCLVGFVF
jgi:hypothetical protein